VAGALGAGADEQSLTDDLADGWLQALGAGANRQVHIKCYDDEAPKPNYPVATATRHEGLFPNSTIPREIRLVLSFKSDHPGPRGRGRIYLPAACFAVSAGLRPTTQMMQDRLTGVTDLFTGLGGINVQWVQKSKLDNAYRTVRTAWVDNDWDIQRSGELGPDARVIRTGMSG
jgi:hypothetical protein